MRGGRLLSSADGTQERAIWLTLIVACLLVIGGLAGPASAAEGENAEAEAEDSPTAEEEESYTLPGITVKAGDQPVEQGDRSLFTALPPRDLMERPLTESPGLETATSVVGEEEIDWMDAYSVVDATKYVPGAWTEARGRKVKEFFSVRGQTYPYPGYLIDGAWFREFHETNYFVSAASLDRIEVLRSSSSMMMSPGGMTGMVNIVPKTYTERETELDVSYGSFDTQRAQVNHGGVAGSTSYGLGFGWHHTDGPNDEHARENMGNFFGRVAQPVNDYLTVSLTTMYLDGDRQLQKAEPPAHPRFLTREDSFDPMRTYMAVGKARYQPSEHALTQFILNYGKRRFHGHRVGSPDWVEEDYEYGGRLTQALELAEGNTLRFGGLYNQWKTPTGKRFYAGNPGDLETYSGMISDEQQIGNLTVEGTYRYTRTYVDQFGGFNVEGSPRGGLRSVMVENEWEDPLQTFNLGASYALTDLTSLHGNIQYGEIGARPGMLDTDLEMPDTETRIKYDVGIKRSWNEFGEVDLSLFYVDQQDAPLASRQTVIVEGDPYVLFENADRDNYGIELDTRTRRFDNGLQGFFNTVVMQSRRTQGGDWTDDVETPDVIIGGGASYLILENLDLSAWLKHVAPYRNQRFAAGSDRIGLGNFTELNTKLTYFWGEENQHEVYFAVDNITDREYSTVVGWPNEGRTYRVGLGMTW